MKFTTTHTNMQHLFVTLLIIVFFSLEISSQTAPPGLNEEFLNSLPADVREDLLKQLEDSPPTEEVDYGFFSSLIDKNSSKDFIDQELLDLRSIEDPRDISIDDLKPFGEDFFSQYPSTFLPVTEPGLGLSYILNSGDTLLVNISGALELETEITISRMGAINIPKVGKLQLTGLSLEQANTLISDFVRTRYSGSTAYLTLAEVADVQVILSGFVEVPGIYTLAGSNSMLGALRAAGGISNMGSYRHINLKRDGQVIQTLDLYKLLLDGDLNLNTALQAGDVLHVGPRNSVVRIYGGVKRPAKFEIIDESIEDLIRYAGGSFFESTIDSISLARQIDNSYSSKSVTSNNFINIALQSNDIIYVPFIDIAKDDFIDFQGAFVKQGKFAAGSDLTKIISAKNLAADAYPLAFLIRDYNPSSKATKLLLTESLDADSLSAYDTVFALSQKDIKFINSNLIKNFFTNPVLEGPYKNCKLFESLANATNSSRFIAAKDIINSRAAPQDTYDENEQDLLPEEVVTSLAKQAPQSIKLFTSEKCQIDYHSILDKDPEILIYLILNSINVEGPSYDSGLLPVSGTATLEKYITFTNIYENNSSPQKLFLTSPNQTIEIKFIDAPNVIVLPGYSINFPNIDLISANVVSVSGAVKNPGNYYVSESTKLSQIIEMAGGYKDTAYPLGGSLLRESAMKVEEQYHQRLYDNLIQTLSTELTQGTPIPFEGLSLILTEFKSIKPVGRVIAEFNPRNLAKNPSADIILESKDRIHIPPRSNIVYVLGEVLSPGPQNYDANYSFFDYIERAGGLTQFVDNSSIIQILPNGESRRIKMGRFSKLFDESVILPGTVIYATKDITKLNNLKLASTLAPVVSSIAISLASLNSISN
ncbi:SLBB domain-containing protein [Gammaproteobacteria bacterium]|nr:SLBB domain-containing protein [Gammaproteobacteria bacterium]